MAFQIHKDLYIKHNPIGDTKLSLTILEKTESLLKLKVGPIALFDVDYRELKSDRAGYRKFHISEAYNQRDK